MVVSDFLIALLGWFFAFFCISRPQNNIRSVNYHLQTLLPDNMLPEVHYVTFSDLPGYSLFDIVSHSLFLFCLLLDISREIDRPQFDVILGFDSERTTFVGWAAGFAESELFLL